MPRVWVETGADEQHWASGRSQALAALPASWPLSGGGPDDTPEGSISLTGLRTQIPTLILNSHTVSKEENMAGSLGLSRRPDLARGMLRPLHLPLHLPHNHEASTVLPGKTSSRDPQGVVA